MIKDYQVYGQVAVITINNPPINSMGLETRSAIIAAMHQALADRAVQAIVVTGAGRAFSGGADINEFSGPAAFAEPSLHAVIDAMERSVKPVIAAIHTICMGGGLELALGCHYRVTTPDAKVALPEVKIGLLPGAGGTQRLPRAVGLEMALNMIVSGEPVRADLLSESGLFDAIIEGDLLQGTLTFANKIAGLRPLPKIRDISIVHSDPETALQLARDRVKSSSEAYPAALKCIEAISGALTLPFDAGMANEWRLFEELRHSTASMALRHAFFAERLAQKIPDISKDTKVRDIKSAAVIGSGTMGGGIAMSFANAGIPVTMLETNTQALEKGLETIRRNYENTFKKGKLTQAQFDHRVGLVQGTLDYSAISQADIVVEAVFEDMDVKKIVFTRLDQVMKQGAILASNTSTLDLNRIAAFTTRPHDVIGTHFFSPASVMKLLEIVRGEKTSKEVVASALALAKKLKKTGVVSGVCDGFIGNRMIEQYIRQAGYLLDEGCLPAQIDKAIEKFGCAMGPFRMSDLAGNDIGYSIRKRRAVEMPEVTYSKTADLLCEMGRFGQKTDAGWYDYKVGDRNAHASAIVNDMIQKHSSDIGVERRTYDDQEIVERLVYALVNEAACILEEGIALRASDIDMVYLTGYGFPLFRGGPMFYADTVGLQNVVSAIQKYAAGRHGYAWKASPLLSKLAAENKTFN